MLETSAETVLLRKSYTSECLSFFSIFVGKKNEKKKARPQSWKRREESEEDGGRCCDDRGHWGSAALFSLYEERALTGARWLCAFLKHQLPEWSCREAMHCGTGASSFFLPPPTPTSHRHPLFCFVFCFLQLPYFNLSGIKGLALHWLWYCCVYFYAVSLPLLLFWSNNNSELLDAEQSLPPTRPIVDSSFFFLVLL